MKDIEKIIKNTTEENAEKINWTKAWSKQYPILKNYQKEIDIKKYQKAIKELLQDMQNTYNYSELDAMLVLKDILYHTWKENNK